MLRDLLHSPIRTSAFLGKEIFEVLRQPRLVLTLILGPFLILLLFGIGYRNEPRAFRAMFVAPASEALSQQIEEYATNLGPQFIFAGLTADENTARTRLRRGDVDLVVVVPTNPAETIRSNQQAVFTIYHNEIDPLQASYVQFVGQVYVEEVNRRVLRQITERGQTDAGTVQEALGAARTSATALREALEAGDAAAARQHQQDLDGNVSALELAVGAGAGLLGGVNQTLGGETNDVDALLEQLKTVRQNTNDLGGLDTSRTDFTPEVEKARQTEAGLTNLESLLVEFQTIEPGILVSPFRSETQGVAALQPRVTDYFAPAVLALLLQHIAVSFGALSLVRERQLGTVELFRVSPISPGETLVGKYLSYLLFGGVLAVVLTLLLQFGLGVPMLGGWDHYALVVLLIIFTSLGFGFVISLLSETASQAVQYTMIVLLASVFFSGFFIALNLLWQPVRLVSWALPVTYGMQLLQSIMLRGQPPNNMLLGGLAVLGLVMFLVAWLMTRRLMARR